MESPSNRAKAIPVHRKNHGTFDPSATPPISPASSRPPSPRANGEASTPAIGTDPLFDGPTVRAVPSSVSSMHHRSSFSMLEFDLDVPVVDEELIPPEEAVSDSEELEDVHVQLLPAHRKSSHSRSSLPRDIHHRGSDSRISIMSEGDIMTKYPSTSRQHVYLEDEDMHILICGFRNNSIGSHVYTILSFLTVGITPLLAHWLPKIWIKFVGRECDLKYADWVVIEVC